MKYLINFLLKNLVASHERIHLNLDYINGVLLPND